MRPINLWLRTSLGIVCATTLVFIMLSVIEFSQQSKAADTTTYRSTSLNEEQLTKIWYKYYSKPSIYATTYSDQPNSLFCLNNHAITLPGDKATVVSLNLVRAYNIPKDNQIPNEGNVTFLFKVLIPRKNIDTFYDNIWQINDITKVTYIAISFDMEKNNINADRFHSFMDDFNLELIGNVKGDPKMFNYETLSGQNPLLGQSYSDMGNNKLCS